MKWEVELLKAKVKSLVKQPLYAMYEKRLADSIVKSNTPNHIGLILDGNRRFARGKGIRRVIKGHAAGADKVDELLYWCEEFNIPVITIWIFSLDNFGRSQEELDDLFTLIEAKTRSLCEDSTIFEKQVRLNYMGRTELLPESLQAVIREAETKTAHHSRFQLNIAIAYGGREEITDAFRSYLADAEQKGQTLESIQKDLSPDSIEPFLYTSGLPEPDLIIRTSGEIRLSGFLLWQSAYAEYYFCDVLWPAFRKIDFMRALRVYEQRHRRFGK